ncbi:MAG: hypothetical protein LBG48_03865 [Rickettsiales bacterium]|jgi:hypothetical protein|nr:hypothetical protein [Rickettsiales bacterium]
MRTYRQLQEKYSTVSKYFENSIMQNELNSKIASSVEYKWKETNGGKDELPRCILPFDK